MNAAERKRKSRENMKKNEIKLNLAKENEKKWDEKRRQKSKALRDKNEAAKIIWREKERLRKKKQREKKKALAISKSLCASPLGSYKTMNTLK